MFASLASLDGFHLPASLSPMRTQYLRWKSSPPSRAILSASSAISLLDGIWWYHSKLFNFLNCYDSKEKTLLGSQLISWFLSTCGFEALQKNFNLFDPQRWRQFQDHLQHLHPLPLDPDFLVFCRLAWQLKRERGSYQSLSPGVWRGHKVISRNPTGGPVYSFLKKGCCFKKTWCRLPVVALPFLAFFSSEIISSYQDN